MKKNMNRQLLRWSILAASVIFTLFLSSFISVHAICPIGGFELFFTGLFAGGFSLAGLFSGMVIIFLIMSVLSIVFRRSYCGYICPMGALQEFFSIAGKHILPAKITNRKVPVKVNNILRRIKYAVLLSFIVGAATIGGHWMLRGDPFIVMMSLNASGGLASAFQRLPFAVLFFIAILISAFFSGRLFCRYICPAGAWYAILSKLSLSRIVRNRAECTGCGLCSNSCPADLDVAHLNTVTSAECIGCRQCETVCPAKALSYKVSGTNIPAVLLPVTAAAVFAGSVTLAQHLLPARGEGGGQGYNGGQKNGQNGSHAYKNGKTEVSGTTIGPAGDGHQQPDSAKNGGCGGNCAACGLCTGSFA